MYYTTDIFSFNPDALIPVTTVHLGESVTFSCFFPDLDYSNTRVKWYKQSVGDTLKLIITLMKASENTAFERGFPSSRFATSHNSTTSTLTISETMEEDEAAYHCGVSTWNQDLWSGTYLSVKGKTCLCIAVLNLLVSQLFNYMIQTNIHIFHSCLL